MSGDPWDDYSNFDPPPAVPVGVQPEPAEERCWCGHLRHKLDGSCRRSDCDCTRYRPLRGGPNLDGPAVPVVHPEPGDRADVGTEFVQQVEAIERGDMDEPLAEWEEALLREDRWLATIWPTYPNGRLRSDEHNLDLARSIMALADAEVAAAVAAVRADLAAEVRAKAKHPPSDPGWVQAVNFVEGYNRALEDAAVLIRGVR